MDVLYFPDDTPPPWLVHPVLALGNFDGVHRGHAAIVGRLVAAARRRGVPAVVLSFDPHPASVVRPDA
ncbi:MAG: bifunctional riboflavin kinase/FAD synthetase, partial [Actinomycetales bacterium]